ncbi:DUF1214 domain-containing protein [Mycobacterium sp. NPDC003323]
MSIRVNTDNFVRAETHRMFRDNAVVAGGLGRFHHNRTPAEIDAQTVIRLNRDTLYSFALVDLVEPVTLTLPDPGQRYLSAMVVNEDHYVNRVIHDAGEHVLTAGEYESRYVAVGIRILVDPNDPDDVAAVALLQEGLRLSGGGSGDFVMPDYDIASMDDTRDALLRLAVGLGDYDKMFGRRDEVDPVRHLIGCAAGWGGLPTSEATYVGAQPDVAAGVYEMVFRDVPVDAFWSVSVYNRQGFFEPNPQGRYSVNSVTGLRNEDGSVTVRFVPPTDGDVPPNAIVTPDGWNYTIRLYRPRPQILDGSWTPPTLTAV